MLFGQLCTPLPRTYVEIMMLVSSQRRFMFALCMMSKGSYIPKQYLKPMSALGIILLMPWHSLCDC